MNLGRHKEGSVIKHSATFDNQITSATGSCGCTDLNFSGNTLNFNWKMNTVPFHLDGEMEVSMSITVWFKDGNKKELTFKAISHK